MVSVRSEIVALAKAALADDEKASEGPWFSDEEGRVYWRSSPQPGYTHDALVAQAYGSLRAATGQFIAAARTRESLIAAAYLQADDYIEGLTDDMLMFANQLGCSFSDMMVSGNTVPDLIRRRLAEQAISREERDHAREGYARLAALYTECELALHEVVPEGADASHFREAVDSVVAHVKQLRRENEELNTSLIISECAYDERAAADIDAHRALKYAAIKERDEALKTVRLLRSRIAELEERINQDAR